MTKNVNIPAYVYQELNDKDSLSQGDVLKVEGRFRQHFLNFYPAIRHPDGEEKYVMVLSQSCDLVKTSRRKPKLSHVNVCLVRSLKAVIAKLIDDEIKPTIIADKRLLERYAADQLKDRLSKLLNNADQKTHFFLPKRSPFVEDMVAILPLSFSFRIDHYDLLLDSRVLSLKPEFQGKVGHIISQLYGRIGTSDLSDERWDDEQTRNYINGLLQDSNLVQVPDKYFLDYVKTNLSDARPDIDELIQECEAFKVDKSFKPMKNELIKDIRNSLIRLFEDVNRVNVILQMGKAELSRELMNILHSATSGGV